MFRISLPTHLRTDTKALPTYLLNISIPEEFLYIYNPAPLVPYVVDVAPTYRIFATILVRHVCFYPYIKKMPIPQHTTFFVPENFPAIQDTTKTPILNQSTPKSQIRKQQQQQRSIR
jgi:hypothetical protein